MGIMHHISIRNWHAICRRTKYWNWRTLQNVLYKLRSQQDASLCEGSNYVNSCFQLLLSICNDVNRLVRVLKEIFYNARQCIVYFWYQKVMHIRICWLFESTKHMHLFLFSRFISRIIGTFCFSDSQCAGRQQDVCSDFDNEKEYILHWLKERVLYEIQWVLFSKKKWGFTLALAVTRSPSCISKMCLTANFTNILELANVGSSSQSITSQRSTTTPCLHELN